MLPGCGGCRKTPQQLQAEREKREAERLARERQKKKPDVELGKLVSLPCESNADFCEYKPGHWTATTLPAKANNFDVLGDLEMTVVDRRDRPIGLLGMPYTSTGSREVAMPKGQAKLLQSVLYVPPTGLDAFRPPPRPAAFPGLMPQMDFRWRVSWLPPGRCPGRRSGPQGPSFQPT